LIELLVVIALISIIGALAVPNLSGWNCRQNTEKDFINLASMVTYMHGLAVDRNRTMRLRFDGTRQFIFYEAESVTKKTACDSNDWKEPPNEAIELKDTGEILYGSFDEKPFQPLVSGSSQVTCFHGDGSVDAGHSTVVWQVGKVCDGKRYDYQLNIHGSTGFVEKNKFNNLKNDWVDF